MIWSEVKLHTPLLVYLIAQDTNTFTQINDLCKLLRHDSKIQLQAALKMSLPCNSVSELTMELFFSIKPQAWFWHLVYWYLSGNGDRYELTQTWCLVFYFKHFPCIRCKLNWSVKYWGLFLWESGDEWSKIILDHFASHELICKSTLLEDSSVPLMYHSPRDLGSLILIWNTHHLIQCVILQFP